MLRNLAARFNRLMAKRVVPARHNREVPIKLSFEPTGKTTELIAPPQICCVSGETRDLSDSGIAFIVPSIRVQENYLVGEKRILNAELDLPSGRLSMKVVGQRYELIGEHISTARYLIGAKILLMTAANRAAYEDFMRGGGRNINAGNLKLSIGES